MRRHRFDFLQKLLVSFCSVVFLASCSHVDKNRSAMTHTQSQVIADILATVVTSPVLFKDAQAAREIIQTVSKTDASCAVVVQLDGSLLAEYTRTSSTLTAGSLAESLKTNLPGIRSAYANDLEAFVTVSPVQFNHQTVAYLALAQK
jgi:hypothetical protein